MTHHAQPPECGRTDAVLAIYLDGDVAAHGFAFACNESLATHLHECAVCQRMLQRARRLDAALAAQAGRTLAEPASHGGSRLADAAPRWFATIAALSSAPPGAAAPRHLLAASTAVAAAPSRRASYAAAASLVLAATVAFLVLGPAGRRPPVPQAGSGTTDRSVPIDAAVSAQTTPSQLPSAADQRLVTAAPASMPCNEGTAEPAETSSAITVAADADAVRRWRQERRSAPNQEPSASPAEFGRHLLDAELAQDQRLAALRHLLTASRPGAADGKGAFLRLTEALAGCGDRSTAERLLHADALDLVRATPHASAQLEAHLLRLDVANPVLARVDLAAITVAARLGQRDLDAVLRRVLRRAPEAATVLAAALRCDVRRPSAGLLLDVWQDLTAIGALGDDQDAAWLWFGGQSPAICTELAAELAGSRSQPRRLHCLLALACAGDDRCLPVLLERLQSHHYEEAHAAAFALASLPHRCLRALLATTTWDQHYLVRAAMARAGLPEARQWTEVMVFSAAERALLDTASLAQFPSVANWFRERGAGFGE